MYIYTKPQIEHDYLPHTNAFSNYADAHTTLN